MLTVFLLAALAQQGGVGAAPSPPEPRVIIAGPLYQPDGAINGEMTALPGTSPTVVYVFSRRTLCETATIAAAEPADAGFGWRVAAHVVSAAPAQVVVSVDWRRIWDAGQRVKNGPGGTAQLTLSPGDRIPLDHIPNGRPNDNCRAVGMGLEVRLGQVPAPRKPGEVTLPLGAQEGGVGSLDVDLWLVHTEPAGGEQAQHQKIRLSTSGGAFTFAPVKFTTRQGEVGLELNGSFLRYTTAGGGEFLLLNMSRVVTGGAAPLAGSTSSFVPLPPASEVLSFEMLSGGGFGARARGGGGAGGAGAGARSSGGAPRGGGGGGVRGGSSPPDIERAVASLNNAMQVTALMDGHRFALRLKVTPVPGS